MPGIQLKYDKEKEIPLKPETLSSIAYFDYYQQKMLLNNNNFAVYSSRYPDYPIKEFSQADLKIILEGYIYNYNDEDFIKQIEKEYFSDMLNDSLILDKVDGDFIVYLINTKTDELVIVNDSLARLPLYYHNSTKTFMCARDLRFITSEINLPVNLKGIIGYLLFMVPAASETLHQNIHKLMPGSILRLDRNTFKVTKYNIWNYEEHNLKDYSFQQVVKECEKLLLEGMENRLSKIKGDTVNILLSGGLDSRTVSAMLMKSGNKAHTHTFIYPDKSNKNDYDTSKEIAHLANFKWHGYEVEELNNENIQELIHLKDSMNYAAMANMLSFLKSIRKENEQYYTGDWGRILKNDFPRERLSSESDLIDYIVKNKTVFQPETIADILDITRKKVYNYIEEILNSYSEKKPEYKYLHFLYQERTGNWLQEGEDRNRKLFWSATPFSNQQLYKFAKNINPAHKRSFRLYKKLLSNIDESFLKIKYGEIGNLRSWHYPLKDRLKLLLGNIPALKHLLNTPKTKRRDFSVKDERMRVLQSKKSQTLFANLEKRSFTQKEFYVLLSLMEYFK